VKFSQAVSSGGARIIDSGQGGGAAAGFQVQVKDASITFAVKDGATNTTISYTDVTDIGTSATGHDELMVYVTRDGVGMRMKVWFPQDLSLNHLPEISGGAAAIAYDVDVAGNPVGINSDGNGAGPSTPLEMYECIFWGEAFTEAEIEDRVKTKRLIRNGDTVKFDLDMRSNGQFYNDKSETAKTIYMTAANVTSTHPYTGAFARWQSSTNGSEWITGVDQKCLPDDFIITGIVAEVNGTPTIQVGTSATGAELVASVALSNGKNYLTMVVNFSSSSKVSVTSNNTDTIDWMVFGHRSGT